MYSISIESGHIDGFSVLQHALSFCTFTRAHVTTWSTFAYPFYWHVCLPSWGTFYDPANRSYMHFLCGHLAFCFSHFITFSKLFCNLSFLLMNQCLPLNVKLQEGRNHICLVYIIILQASSTVPGIVWTFSQCLLNEMNALLSVFTSIISVGVKLNNLERILMKHEMLVD